MLTRLFDKDINATVCLRKIWVLLWFGLLLNACTSANSSEFFGNGTCTPPCWQYMTPGTTIERDAVAILHDPQLVKSETLRPQQTGDPQIQEYWYHLQQPSIGSIGSVTVKDGVVNTIYLNPHFDVTLGDLVDRFGEPIYLFVQEMPGDLVCYDIGIYYPNQGIMARLLNCHDLWRDASVPMGSTRLSEESIIESVYYFEPATTLDQALLNIWLPEQIKVDHILANVADWRGFGIYKSR